MAKYTATCKFCNNKIVYEHNEHIFNTYNAIEKCRYFTKAINHYLEYHNGATEFSYIERIRIYIKTIVKGIIKDILGLLLLPFSLIVSVLYKIFEWLNNKIGMFD